MSIDVPARPRVTEMDRLVDDCIHDLISPWNNRTRYESQVIGAIELAFRRGHQAGQELPVVTATQETDQVIIRMTRDEALCLMQGAAKGNIIYGSVASKDGQTTLRLAERFLNELGIDILTGDLPEKGEQTG